MQFGKIHGIALVVLGIFLFGVQGLLSVMPRHRDLPAESSLRTIEHKTTSLPAIIGAASLVLGIALLFTARRRDEPDAKHAVK
jgi:hypothetical protein